MKERLLTTGSDLSRDLENDLEQTITFNMTKNELFKVTENLKTLNRKLKSTFRVNVNRENIDKDNDLLKSARIFVIPGPRTMFEGPEIDYLQQMLDSGKSLLILANEGGDIAANTNLNQLLEPFGVNINSDCVIRTQYSKYFLPKECYLNDGSSNSLFGYLDSASGSWSYVYPFGATLTVTKPSVTALASGNGSFPANRPLCAVYVNRNTNGRLVILGSGSMLTDKYIDHEQNDKFCEKLFQFLSEDLSNINDIDVDEFDIWDYHMVPDIPMLAEKPQLGLVDSANTIDFTKLFNTQLYSLNTDFIPEIIRAFEETNVKHSPLTLIVPRFEEAIPKLQLAVFPPSFCELPPPPLELFDLEEEFSGEETQLSQLTNRFLTSTETHTDLENYVKEAAEILGVGSPEYGALRQVYECALIISNFKMSNLDLAPQLEVLRNEYEEEVVEDKDWNRDSSTNILSTERDSDEDSFDNNSD